MLAEQIAAVWFLLEYEEYYNITDKIFSNKHVCSSDAKEWHDKVLPVIQELREKEIPRRKRRFFYKIKSIAW
jgi:hypothetical protein